MYTHQAYTGIGSRKIDRKHTELIQLISKCLSKLNFKLISGGASGADTNFAEAIEGSGDKSHLMEIVLPWNGFGSSSNLNCTKVGDTEFSRKVGRYFHPKWDSLNETVKKLIARNTYQVLDFEGNVRVDFVICYTPDGSTGETSYATGGTGQALRIAKHFNVPIFNVKNKSYHHFIDFYNNHYGTRS
jgi:hypothetical protein